MQIKPSWYGQTSYSSGQALQENTRLRVSSARNQTPGFLLGFEFDPVITLGKRGSVASDLRCELSELKSLGVDMAEVDRGGHATLHSPGQLVIYPILSLSALGWSVRQYVDWLQTITLNCLTELGVDSGPGPEPGLYTDNGKIAFFGVRVLGGVTQHGVSVNVSNKINLFDLIVSCGRSKERFDRICDHNVSISTQSVFEIWTDLAVQSLTRSTGRRMLASSFTGSLGAVGSASP